MQFVYHMGETKSGQNGPRAHAERKPRTRLGPGRRALKGRMVVGEIWWVRASDIRDGRKGGGD